MEDVVIQATKENLPTDKTIDFISDCIIELQEKATDTTALDSINNQIKEVENSIKNVMSAIEAGIITDTTKERLLELETRQAKLQSQKRIESKKIKSPKILKDQIVYWLEKFKEGDIDDEAYREQVINTFVDTIVLFPDVLAIAYKYSGENDIIDVDLKALKNSSDSVRMSVINWNIGDLNPWPQHCQCCALPAAPMSQITITIVLQKENFPTNIIFL